MRLIDISEDSLPVWTRSDLKNVIAEIRARTDRSERFLTRESRAFKPLEADRW
jgi:hypothetical protein